MIRGAPSEGMQLGCIWTLRDGAGGVDDYADGGVGDMCESDGDIGDDDGGVGDVDDDDDDDVDDDDSDDDGDVDDDDGDDDDDTAHRGIGHASLDRLKIKQQLGGRAVLQHLDHLLQHRQVHRLYELHRRLHLLHFVQDFFTFRPRTLFVYVPSIRSDLLIHICDVAEKGNSLGNQTAKHKNINSSHIYSYNQKST